MDDVDTGAPVDSAPVADAPVATPAPISNDPIPAEPAPAPEPVKDDKPKEPVSTRDALKKAAEKVEADSKTKDEAKPEAKAPEKLRAEDGKFAPTKPADVAAKPAEAVQPVQAPAATKSTYEAPARFHAEAKAAWEAAPEPVRAEVVRLEKELSQGLEKYKESHARDEALKDFHEMAAKGGTDIKTALTNYTNMERQLRENPIKGFEAIAANLGVPFRDIAAAYLNQPADQHQSQSDATIIELRNELAAIKQQVGGVTQSIQQQRQSAVLDTINAFKADHPRYDELEPDMVLLIETKRAKDLAEAYSLAERLNPAAAPPIPVASSAPVADTRQAQTLKGTKSVNGSPTPGSNPSLRQPSSTIKDALRRAMAQAG